MRRLILVLLALALPAAGGAQSNRWAPPPLRGRTPGLPRGASACDGGSQGNNASYMATTTPAASGTVTVDIAAGAAQDGDVNPSAAAVQFSIVADLTPVPALPVIGTLALALVAWSAWSGARAAIRPRGSSSRAAPWGGRVQRRVTCSPPAGRPWHRREGRPGGRLGKPRAVPGRRPLAGVPVALLGPVHSRVRDREVAQVGRDVPAPGVRDAAVVRFGERDDVLDIRRRSPIRPDVERQQEYGV